jgi:hypothetical protein
MPDFIDQEGTFRGAVIAQDLYEAKSGAVAISNTFEATEMWDRASESWRPIPSHSTRGRTYVIGKDQTINPTGVDQMLSIGWDSSIAGVKANPYVNRPCTFTVKRDGKYFNATWISPYDQVPGSGGGEKYSANASRAEALDAQYGAQFRAMGQQYTDANPEPVTTLADLTGHQRSSAQEPLGETPF